MATTATVSPRSALHELVAPEINITDPTDGVRLTESLYINAQLQQIAARPIDELLSTVTNYIERRIDEAEGSQSPSEPPVNVESAHQRQIEVCLRRFKAAKVPAVSIREYLLRLHRHCPFSAAKLLAIVHYLTVINVLYMNVAKVLRRTTAHRLILAAVVVASKVIDDRLIPQVRFSVVGGIDRHQLLGLELAFFFLMNGKCWLREDDLLQASSFLEGTMDAHATLHTLSDSKATDIIWSEVGNRDATT